MKQTNKNTFYQRNKAPTVYRSLGWCLAGLHLLTSPFKNS